LVDVNAIRHAVAFGRMGQPAKFGKKRQLLKRIFSHSFSLQKLQMFPHGVSMAGAWLFTMRN
jgi:hypothetical protein